MTVFRSLPGMDSFCIYLELKWGPPQMTLWPLFWVEFRPCFGRGWPSRTVWSLGLYRYPQNLPEMIGSLHELVVNRPQKKLEGIPKTSGRAVWRSHFEICNQLFFGGKKIEHHFWKTKGRISGNHHILCFPYNTVDGSNPAPVDMANIPSFTWFYHHPKWLALGFLNNQQYDNTYVHGVKGTSCSPFWRAVLPPPFHPQLPPPLGCAGRIARIAPTFATPTCETVECFQVPRGTAIWCWTANKTRFLWNFCQ